MGVVVCVFMLVMCFEPGLVGHICIFGGRVVGVDLVYDCLLLSV